ncbi:ATP-binding protein [Craterilacuibacter sp. RT1T]|uniref:ATP-binding protein n=1 Tax=Craterilacuibacter sp. RT1T TaxID=2942211 RepID=UPI0020BDE61E|nr:ATP-binding protein [Craterilacuibacter sp. RT1T]MCL6264524.1 ATP-binding protein [Craterilacuibacter sp. RT1T]
MSTQDRSPTYLRQKIQEYQDNPLIEALPPILSAREAGIHMMYKPPFDLAEKSFTVEERWHLLGRLKHLVAPRPYFYQLERTVSRLIRSGYVLRNPCKPETWQAVYKAQANTPPPLLHRHLTATDSECVVVGLSGMGKTTAIDAVLRTYPQQLIRHQRWRNKPLPIQQLVWLKVTCPKNGSILAFCREFARQLDLALGTQEYEKMYSRSRVTTDEAEGMMRQHAATYFLGVLVIDEIQRLSVPKSGGAERLLDFIQNLRDMLKVPIVLVGTYKAVSLFKEEMKDARRASESGLLDFKRPVCRDAEWDKLVERLWNYQWVHNYTSLTPSMQDRLFDLTQGVTDFLVILFKLTQQRVMEDGTETLTEAAIQATYDESFPLLQPAINALRKNTIESLFAFEDLLPPDRYLDQLRQPQLPCLENLEEHIDELFEVPSHASPPAPVPAAPKKGGRSSSPSDPKDLRHAVSHTTPLEFLHAAGHLNTASPGLLPNVPDE